MTLFARAVRRSLLDSQHVRPSTFLLPFRATLTTVSHTLEAGNVPEPLIKSGHHTPKDLKKELDEIPHAPKVTPKTSTLADAQTRQDLVAKQVTPSIRQMLPLLHSQPHHYITIHIHGRPYLITKGDVVRLPFLMPNVKPGDVLRLNRATHIGSRDFTLKAPEPIKGTADHGKKFFYLDDKLFVCRATVTSVASEPLRIMEKTKRRQRHVKHVKSKHKYTVLTISEIEVKSLEEYESLLKKQ